MMDWLTSAAVSGLVLLASADPEVPPDAAPYLSDWTTVSPQDREGNSVVVLRHEVTASEGTVRQTIVYALFDASEREQVLTRRFDLPIDAEMKRVVGWSYDAGSGYVAETTPDDIHSENYFDFLQRVTVLIPGALDSGLVGLRLIYEDSGVPAGDMAEIWPVKHASYQYLAPRADRPETDDDWRRVRGRFRIEGADSTLWAPLSPRGWKLECDFYDIPPLTRCRYVPAELQTKAFVKGTVNPRWWSRFARIFDQALEHTKSPKELKKICKKFDKDASDPDKISFVADFLGNTDHFKLKLTGERMYGALEWPFGGDWDPEATWRARGGAPFEKALLGILMLRELDVRACLSFGFSRYHVDQDPAVDFLDDVQAVLLHIPAGGSDRFFWNVADPAVELGSIGPEFHGRVVVMDPELSGLWVRADLSEGAVEERRTTDWVYEGDNRVAGDCRWVYAGAPWDHQINPWYGAPELPSQVEATLQNGWTVLSAESSRRATGDSAGVGQGTISFRIEGEFESLGSDDLECRILTWDCPAALSETMRLNGGSVLIARPVNIEESSSLSLDGLTIQDLPDSLVVENFAGKLAVGWRADDGRLTAVRALSVRDGKLPATYVKELASAWIRAGDQPVRAMIE